MQGVQKTQNFCNRSRILGKNARWALVGRPPEFFLGRKSDKSGKSEIIYARQTAKNEESTQNNCGDMCRVMINRLDDHMTPEHAATAKLTSFGMHSDAKNLGQINRGTLVVLR